MVKKHVQLKEILNIKCFLVQDRLNLFLGNQPTGFRRGHVISLLKDDDLGTENEFCVRSVLRFVWQIIYYYLYLVLVQVYQALYGFLDVTSSFISDICFINTEQLVK